VPRFDPFIGLRYNLDQVRIDDVTAPPYDVIDDEERARLTQRHPDNIVHVDLPRSDTGDPYAGAATELGRWRRGGILVEDAQPTFYVYRMDFTDELGRRRHTTGVIGALELSQPGEGGILPHEHTTPKAKSDRLDLLRATGVQLSPIWGLSPALGLGELCDLGRPPLATWSDEHGVTHSLWLDDEPAHQREISALVGTSPIVIADGHHRYETSLAYRDEQRAEAGPGPYDLVMTLVVELADEELTVLPIHRLLRGLPPGFDLRRALEPFFESTPVDPVDHTIGERMGAAGALALVTNDGAWLLAPRPETMKGARDLDSSRLDVALDALPPHEVVYQHGVDNVVARVAKGEADAGVLLRPATVDQIVDIANGGERMPPKTTFFHPKPRTGVVLRDVSG
jgi:uncharacterized protein (DUF1015 family)